MLHQVHSRPLVRCCRPLLRRSVSTTKCTEPRIELLLEADSTVLLSPVGEMRSITEEDFHTRNQQNGGGSRRCMPVQYLRANAAAADPTKGGGSTPALGQHMSV